MAPAEHLAVQGTRTPITLSGVQDPYNLGLPFDAAAWRVTVGDCGLGQLLEAGIDCTCANVVFSATDATVTCDAPLLGGTGHAVVLTIRDQSSSSARTVGYAIPIVQSVLHA